MAANGVVDAFRAHCGPRWRAVLDRAVAPLEIRDEPSALGALTEFARCLGRPLDGVELDRALVLTRRISDDFTRATTLTRLVPIAAQGSRKLLTDEAVAAAGRIGADHPRRARAMIAIGMTVEDVEPLVHEIIESARASIMMFGVVDDLCKLV